MTTSVIGNANSNEAGPNNAMIYKKKGRRRCHPIWDQRITHFNN